MARIGIILGSTRPHRVSPALGQWALSHLASGSANTYEIIDLRDHSLPFYDEPLPPRAAGGNYQHEHTQAWAQFVSGFDGFVVILPEYNGNMPAVLKNALDYLFVEWEGKPITYISFGGRAGMGSSAGFEAATGGWGFTLLPTHINIRMSRSFFNEAGELVDADAHFAEHLPALRAIDADLSQAVR